MVLALGLYFGTGEREQRGGVPPGQLAFPNLASKLPDAASLEVVHRGATLKLTRNGTAWGVADRNNYPAEPGKVRELTTALTELKLIEPRTANPDDYARLGVEDAQGKDATSTLVRVLDGKGAAIAEVTLGHRRNGANGAGDGLYVRRGGEAQAWLAEGQASAGADAMDWIDSAIADIGADKVASVTVARDGQTLSFTRKDGAMTLTAPADHPPLDKSKLEEVGRALDSLKLTDVQPAPPPGQQIAQTAIVTADGMTVTATVNKNAADLWLQIAAAGEGKAKAAADALSAKTKGWAYKVGEWKEAAFAPTLDGLKAEQPAPAKP